MKIADWGLRITDLVGVRTARVCERGGLRRGARGATRPTLALAALVLPTGIFAMDDYRFIGPTELQDSFLPTQLRYQAYPESTAALPQGDWRVNVTVDWSNDLARTGTYLFDGETITHTLKVRQSPAKHWEFGFDVPYTRRIDGVADEFIEFVETTLNAKVDARYQLPRDTYNSYIAGPNGTVLTFRKASSFQDTTFRAKYQFLDSTEGDCVDMAAVGTFTIPTGGENFGGHGVSPGLGLHVQKPVSKYLNLFIGGAGNYYSNSREQLFVFDDWRGMGYLGGEGRVGWFGLAVMYQVYTPFAPENAPLNASAHYYSVMGRFFLGKNVTFETGVVENLGQFDNRNSTDVTFKFSLTAHF
jgi:hypothetical protein